MFSNIKQGFDILFVPFKICHFIGRVFLKFFYEHFLEGSPEILRHSAVNGKVKGKEQADEGIDHKTNVARNVVV